VFRSILEDADRDLYKYMTYFNPSLNMSDKIFETNMIDVFNVQDKFDTSLKI
jgi:hypothetical protein